MRITVVKGYAVESWAASGWPEPTGGPYSPGVAVFGSRARTSALAAGGGHAHLVSRSLVRPAMADTAKGPIPPVSSRGRLSAPLPQYPPSGRNRLPLLQHGGVAPLDDVGHRDPARAVIPRTVRELRLRAPGHMAADPDGAQAHRRREPPSRAARPSASPGGCGAPAPSSVYLMARSLVPSPDLQ